MLCGRGGDGNPADRRRDPHSALAALSVAAVMDALPERHGYRAAHALLGRDACVTGVRITHIGGPTVADRGGRLAAAHRPDVRPPGRSVPLRLGDRLAQARRARRSRPTDARADRRGPAQPRPPRRQPRRRRPRAAARRPASSSRRCRARGGSAAAPRARPLATHAARGARQADDRDHRDAVPPRAAAAATRSSATSSASRCAGRARSTACCGSPATPCSTTACARSPTRLEVDTAIAAPRRRPVPGHRPGALHDDRATTRSSCAALVEPRTAIPIHYEGWKHFQRGPRRPIEREFAGAPADVQREHPLAPHRRAGRAV